MPAKKKSKGGGKKKGKRGSKKSAAAAKPGDPFVKNEIPSPLKPGERVTMIVWCGFGIEGFFLLALACIGKKI